MHVLKGLRAISLLFALCAACSGTDEEDNRADARTPDGVDASADSAIDASPGSVVDASADSAVDASPDSDARVDGDGAIDASTSTFECRDARPLRCGDRSSGNTSTDGQPNLWLGYGCTARAESGPEVVYAFRSDARCQVSVHLDELSEDLDLIVMDACDPYACQDVSSTPLDLQTLEAVEFQADARRDYVVTVDGYSESSGSYAMAVNCLCGEGELGFSDGEWLFQVDRRWNSALAGVPSSSAPLLEEHYEPVTDGASYATLVQEAWRSISIGAEPWLGELAENPAGKLSYELTGPFAGGRFLIWTSSAGLQAELTMYGSGVPIASSERGALLPKP